MRTLIKNGTIVTAVDQYKGDVLVEDEKIAVIGMSLDIPAANVDAVIDAAGKYVLPGGIDVHTHLDMPFGGATSDVSFGYSHGFSPEFLKMLENLARGGVETAKSATSSVCVNFKRPAFLFRPGQQRARAQTWSALR